MFCEVAFREGKPSDCELDELAGKISAKWETLGIHLGIIQDVVDEIAANAKKKPYTMLLHWKRTTTSLSPYEDLHKAYCVMSGLVLITWPENFVVRITSKEIT